MARLLLALALVIVPVAARAFSQCTVTAIGGPGAEIAEEGANPVAWANYVYTGYVQGRKVFVLSSSDGGKTLGAPVRLFDKPNHARNLRLAVSYQHVYALWGRIDAGVAKLMFSSSNDHAAKGSWTKPISLGAYKGSALPQLSADGKNVHVAYVGTDGMIGVRNSTDAGRSFGPAIAIAPGAMEVVVKSAGQNVFVAWNSANPRIDVYFAVSHDGGNTFETTDLSADRPSNSGEPILALDPKAERLSLVWRENKPSQGAYLQSLDNGDSWSEPIFIDAPTRQYMVVDDGSYIYLSYLKMLSVDGAADWQIYLTYSTDGGKSFGPPKNLSGVTGISTLLGDLYRPVPWISSTGAFRLTGVEADGVHAWNGRDGHILTPIYLGRGDTASPAANAMTWQNGDQGVDFAVCH
jgi:hypothetical protein